MKNIIQLLMILCLAGMVNALMTCSVTSGDCAIEDEEFYNQTHRGATIENVSVNVTINGTGASPTGWCNVACVVGKSYGNYTNQTNASVMHNITWCNLETKMMEGSTSLYILNQSALADNVSCNITMAIELNSSNNISVLVRPNPNRADTDGYPLIYYGATALAGATIAYLWRKRRRT